VLMLGFKFYIYSTQCILNK